MSKNVQVFGIAYISCFLNIDLWCDHCKDTLSKIETIYRSLYNKTIYSIPADMDFIKKLSYYLSPVVSLMPDLDRSN